MAEQNDETGIEQGAALAEANRQPDNTNGSSVLQAVDAPCGDASPGIEELQRKNRLMMIALGAIGAVVLLVCAFLAGRVSQAGTIAAADLRVAALVTQANRQHSQISGLQAQLATSTAQVNSLGGQLAVTTERATGAESSLASSQAKNFKLNSSLDRAKTLMGLYRDMGEIDTDMSNALNRALRDISISWDAGNKQNWTRCLEYAGKADDAVAEANRLAKKRKSVLNRIEAASS